MKCRLLPQGAYCLIPIAFSSMAFWSLLVQDGCDYAQLSGTDMVETVSGLTVYPFLEIGRRGYRPPMYDANQKSWVMVYTQQCTPYSSNSHTSSSTSSSTQSNASNNTTQIFDMAFSFSKWCTLISFVFGGSVTLFLWCMTALTLSIRTWRFCGFWMGVALIFRLSSFVFFRTHMCTSSSSSRCSWFYGAQMDLAGSLAWLVGTIAIFAYYPRPSSSSSSIVRKSTSRGGDGLMRDGSEEDSRNTGILPYQDGTAELRPMTTRRGSGRAGLV